MNVTVALFAFARCGFEVNVYHLQFQIRWLVTIGTCHRPVSPHQLEVGGGVIELVEVLPSLNGVTGETS